MHLAELDHISHSDMQPSFQYSNRQLITNWLITGLDLSIAVTLRLTKLVNTFISCTLGWISSLSLNFKHLVNPLNFKKQLLLDSSSEAKNWPQIFFHAKGNLEKHSCQRSFGNWLNYPKRNNVQQKQQVLNTTQCQIYTERLSLGVLLQFRDQ